MAKRKKNNPHKNPNATTHISAYKNYNSNVVMALAYMHRYLFPIALGLLPVLIATIIGKDSLFILYGCAFLAYGLYDIIGYKCKWRHIYCSYQNANRRKMTPNHIHWDEVKKSDIYAMAAVMGVLGVACIVASFYL